MTIQNSTSGSSSRNVGLMRPAVPETSSQVSADSGLPVAKVGGTNGRRDPPSPPGNFLVGHANQMLRRSTDFLLESHHKYGDAIRLKLGPRTAFALFHPDHVYHVLVKRRENFTKQARGYQKLRKIPRQWPVDQRG